MKMQDLLPPATHDQLRDILGRLDRAVAALIDRDTEDDNLRDARCLLTSALMRAVGISGYLRCEVATFAMARLIRSDIHKTFGAPGDWGGEIGDALRDLYRLPIGEPEASHANR